MILGCRSVVLCSSGVVSLSLIGDISYKAFVAIGMVGDVLDASIRQVDRVGSLHIACSVTALISAEHSLGVVVGHGVAVGVGEDLVGVVGWLGVVGRVHWGVVSRGSLICWCRWSCVGVSMVGRCGAGVGRCRGGVDRCWSSVDCRCWLVSRCRGGIGRCWSRGRSWCRGVIRWGRGVISRGLIRCGSCGRNQAKKDLKRKRFQRLH